MSEGKILMVWEDDDIYLPHHISSHVTAMEGHLWSKPSKVLSDYSGQIQEEDATGRHGSNTDRIFQFQSSKIICSKGCDRIMEHWQPQWRTGQ